MKLTPNQKTLRLIKMISRMQSLLDSNTSTIEFNGMTLTRGFIQSRLDTAFSELAINILFITEAV